jgi:hypothetical protein
MVRKRSIKALEHEIEIQKAVSAVKSNQYKSVYAAAKAFKLPERTLQRRIEARQQQQLLSKNQEQTLLKWIKELTYSGYAPSHRILQEVADEVRSNKCRIFQAQQLQLQPQIPKLPLRQD